MAVIYQWLKVQLSKITNNKKLDESNHKLVVENIIDNLTHNHGIFFQREIQMKKLRIFYDQTVVLTTRDYDFKNGKIKR